MHVVVLKGVVSGNLIAHSYIKQLCSGPTKTWSEVVCAVILWHIIKIIICTYIGKCMCCHGASASDF